MQRQFVGHLRRRGVVDGKCAAAKAEDCRQSNRCKLEGSCSLKDGACIAASSGDCAGSSVCTKAKRCIASGGQCVSGGGGGKDGPAGGGAPDKTRSTTIGALGI